MFLGQERDLRAYIGSLVREPAEREDVFQNVAVVLWEKFEEYNGNKGAFGAWARGIATRKVLQERRKNARFPLALPPEAIERVLEAFERTEASSGEAVRRERALAECLKALPDKSRQLMEWRYEDGVRGAKLARRMKRSVDAVYQMLSRVRTQLGGCIRGKLANSEV